jgi:DNA ligase-1
VNRAFRVPYAALAQVFGLIETTTKRLEISAFLTEFLVTVIEKSPGELLRVIYLCINRVRNFDTLFEACQS